MTTHTSLKKRNSPIWNFSILGFVVFISSCMLYFGNYGTLEISKSLVSLVPFILGIGTILIYLLSRLFTKRYNWIITSIGMCIILFIALPIFFGVARYQ